MTSPRPETETARPNDRVGGGGDAAGGGGRPSAVTTCERSATTRQAVARPVHAPPQAYRPAPRRVTSVPGGKKAEQRDGQASPPGRLETRAAVTSTPSRCGPSPAT